MAEGYRVVYRYPGNVWVAHARRGGWHTNTDLPHVSILTPRLATKPSIPGSQMTRPRMGLRPSLRPRPIPYNPLVSETSFT